MFHSSNNPSVTVKNILFVQDLEESGETPHCFMAAYWNLVYHIPTGTAHSKDTSLSTILSTWAKDTFTFAPRDCSKGRYLATLSSGTENLDLKLSHSHCIPK